MTYDTQASRPQPPGDTQPVPVHVTGAAKSRRKLTRFETYVLTASDPAQCILPESEDRICAYVQAIDNDIVLGPTKGVVAAAVNIVVNVPSPNGAYIPKANTVPYPVEGTNAVYAGITTSAANSRVAVVETYYAEEDGETYYASQE